MRAVWKYPFSIHNTLTLIQAPRGAKVLSVQVQHGNEPCIWMLVDPGAEREPKYFRAHWTGHMIPTDPGEYVGTVQVDSAFGMRTVHMFEVARP